MPLDLEALQRVMWQVIAAPEGVTAALGNAGRAGRELELAVVGDARLDGPGRLGIYSHMIAVRLREALAATYPRLAAVVGDERFAELSAAYFAACPSRHPSMRSAGDRLAGFLDGAGEPGGLGDLARLEWARADVFDERDEPILMEAVLRALAPQAFAELPVRIVAAHRRLELAHDVLALWRDDGPATAGASHVLVWRQGVNVYHRAADALETHCLRVAADGDGVSFGELCTHILDEIGEEQAPARAFGVLARWAADELLVDCRPIPDTSETAPSA